MESKDYYRGAIKIDHKWLFLPSGERIKLSEITNMYISWKPKRRVILITVIWLALIYLAEFFEINSGMLFFVMAIILFGGPFVIYDSIKYNLHEAETALILNLSSGYEAHIHADKYSFLEEIRDTILKATSSGKDVLEININNYGIVNIADKISNK